MGTHVGTQKGKQAQGRERDSRLWARHREAGATGLEPATSGVTGASRKAPNPGRFPYLMGTKACLHPLLSIKDYGRFQAFLRRLGTSAQGGTEAPPSTDSAISDAGLSLDLLLPKSKQLSAGIDSQGVGDDGY